MGIIIWFYIHQMDTSLVILGSLFLITYITRTVFDSIEILYNIYADIEDRQKEHQDEEDKNKLPDSVKHLYS